MNQINILKKLNFLYNINKQKINEMYYENPEGITYSDYDTWLNTLKKSHTNVNIIPENDVEAAYLGQEIIGFWDLIASTGIIYNLNLVHKESIQNASFEVAEFSDIEIQQITNIISSTIVDNSGLIYLYNDQYALIKFKSGTIELLRKQDEEYYDYKVFNSFEDMLKSLQSQLHVIKESHNSFNLLGFQENMEPYVFDIDKCIDYDPLENMYFITIPFSQLRSNIKLPYTANFSKNIDVANKITRIAKLYPKCKLATIDTKTESINLVFTNF